MLSIRHEILPRPPFYHAAGRIVVGLPFLTVGLLRLPQHVLDAAPGLVAGGACSSSWRISCQGIETSLAVMIRGWRVLPGTSPISSSQSLRPASPPCFAHQLLNQNHA